MLCHSRGRFLYEIMPDYFPEGILTDTEIELWELHYEAHNQRVEEAKAAIRR